MSTTFTQILYTFVEVLTHMITYVCIYLLIKQKFLIDIRKFVFTKNL